MRKLLVILLVLSFAGSVQMLAQSYPITGINISLPSSPDANIANWGTGTSLVSISATAQTVNGRIDPAVEESKLLAIIKKGGSQVCGAYTGSSAPQANFRTLTKVWSGTNATSFLGQSCVLPPGDYELCVQFFGYSNGKFGPLSQKTTKPFTIKGSDQQYQPPQGIAPADGSAFSEQDLKKPITFRWTPVIPKPQASLTYSLKVVELQDNQSPEQAIKTNQPIIEKDVDNLTQASVQLRVSGPCLPPHLCSFVWNVQALSRDGKPIGGNNGLSRANRFGIRK